MSDESYRHRIQEEVASGIGEYIESIDSDSDIVERFCQTVEVYKIELEEDLKLFYDAKHDYVADDEVIIIGDILLFILKSKDSLSEKEVEIQREEYQKLKEREMKTKITGDRKKVTANASVLYTFIHWEVMKTLQVHINS